MSPRYQVLIARRAVKLLATLERGDQQRLRAAIDLLADNPRPPKAVALQGMSGVLRIRVGDFRVLYEVIDEALVVHVITLGHRRDVYR